MPIFITCYEELFKIPQIQRLDLIEREFVEEETKVKQPTEEMRKREVKKNYTP